jgi:orotate phosphoribosyltransferase
LAQEYDTLNYRSIKTLNQHIIDWIPKLPKNIEILVGIPRSGLLVANLLSLYLNKPLADFESFVNSKIISGGVRFNIASQEDFFKSRRRVLVVDDSLYSGAQMRLAKKTISDANLHHHVQYAAVYITPGNENMVDFFYEIVPFPRVFEWNIMHHGDMPNWCVDIDGVLCRDPTDEENDDGPRYLHFLKTVEPLIIPSMPIGWLVTCRLEKYRQITEEWLAMHKISYGTLLMMNFPSKQARIESGSHSSFKASIYKKTAATLFIESSLNQAREIARLSGKDVFCIETREMINSSFLAKIIHKPQEHSHLLLRNPRQAFERAYKFIKKIV